MVRVKICGITQAQDARVAANAGADAIGIVFYAPSPRYVHDLGLAAEIAQAVGPFVAVVGLFVDANPSYIEQVLAAVPLNVLQFHGAEPAAFCASFERPYIKALRMKPGTDIAAIASTYGQARGILLDAYRKGVPGGTGETFDWAHIPSNLPAPLILAGGLTPANVAQACASVKPNAVDVSGGVESAHGIKSTEAVHQFITEAKRYSL